MTTKIEELQAQIASGLKQIADAEKIIASERQGDGGGNALTIQSQQELITAWREDIARGQAALAEEEQEQAKQYEQRVDQTRGEIAAKLDDLEFAGMPIRTFFMSAEQYIGGMSVIKQRFLDVVMPLIEGKRISDENAAKAQQSEVQWQRQYRELQEKYVVLETDHEKLQENYDKLIGEHAEEKALRLDAEQKRDAAAATIEDWQGRYRLKDEELDRLRMENVVGAREAYKVIDADEQERIAEEIKMQKTIFDVRPNRDINPTSYTAKYAATGEEFTFEYYLKRNYTIIDESEVSQFREAYKKFIPITIDNPSLPYPALGNGEDAQTADEIAKAQREAAAGNEIFPGQEETTDAGIPGETSGSVSGEVAEQEPLSVEDILNQHRERLEALERVVYGKPGTAVA